MISSSTLAALFAPARPGTHAASPATPAMPKQAAAATDLSPPQAQPDPRTRRGTLLDIST